MASAAQAASGEAAASLARGASAAAAPAAPGAARPASRGCKRCPLRARRPLFKSGKLPRASTPLASQLLLARERGLLTPQAWAPCLMAAAMMAGAAAPSCVPGQGRAAAPRAAGARGVPASRASGARARPPLAPGEARAFSVAAPACAAGAAPIQAQSQALASMMLCAAPSALPCPLHDYRAARRQRRRAGEACDRQRGAEGGPRRGAGSDWARARPGSSLAF